METHDKLPPIERWWPELSITAKHELQEDLEGKISNLVLKEIEALLACSLPRSRQHLSESDRAFIKTQIEIVD
ncbi:hypothetical protein [Salinibacterium sp. TMP30]|uniref:hypothetical protein n=1 Tax=Salinibacterium sp. TMP30 TaxID=3138237 RepID=UPI0031388546